MTTQAELGGPRGLADGSADGRTAVGSVGRGGKKMVPERQLAGPMRSVAENADFGLGGCFDRSGPDDREVVLGA